MSMEDSLFGSDKKLGLGEPLLLSPEKRAEKGVPETNFQSRSPSRRGREGF
jgi:hypothetical protein